MFSKTVLTEQETKKRVADWVSYSLRNHKIKNGQYCWLLTELTKLCAAESIRVGEDEFELDLRLQSAHEILSLIQSYGFPSDLEKVKWDDPSTLSEPIKKRLDQASASVWKRRDPMRSFKEGFESLYHFGGSPSEIHSVLGDYLKFRWLRHPSVDWIFLDMMTTRELSALGEHIKMSLLPGKKDSIGVHTKYFTSRGKLSDMTKRTGLAMFTRPSKECFDPNSPFSKASELWESMYNTWRCLNGPVINPTTVRDEMMKSKNDGGIWDGPSWALIDRVIEFDRAVWLVGNYSEAEPY